METAKQNAKQRYYQKNKEIYKELVKKQREEKINMQNKVPQPLPPPIQNKVQQPMPQPLPPPIQKKVQQPLPQPLHYINTEQTHGWSIQMTKDSSHGIPLGSRTTSESKRVVLPFAT